jgi:hypothetical protein
MKKNLTESFIKINSLAKFLKHVLFISLVILTLGSCVNFRSGVHPKLVKNVKTYPSTAQGNLSKNDTLTEQITSDIVAETKRSEGIHSSALEMVSIESKSNFPDLKPDLIENTPKTLTTDPKIKTNQNKQNAFKPIKKVKTNEELDTRQSNNAMLFGILAIISFFSIFLSPLIFIFCPLAFFNGRRVLKRGSAQLGSKELRRAKFGAGIGAAFYIGWTLFFGVLLILFLSGNI